MAENLPLATILREPQTVPLDTDCAEAARVMRDENVGTVVVTEHGRPLGIVDECGVLTGLVTTDDLLLAIASELNVLASIARWRSAEQTETLRRLLGDASV